MGCRRRPFPFFPFTALGRVAGGRIMFPQQEHSFYIGQTLVSPSAQVTETGHFAPSVSLRRGRGSGTLDKVFRFTRRFASHHHALAYAARQGRELACPKATASTVN